MQDQVNRIDLAAIVSGPACNAWCQVQDWAILAACGIHQLPTPVMVNGRSVNDQALGGQDILHKEFAIICVKADPPYKPNQTNSSKKISLWAKENFLVKKFKTLIEQISMQEQNVDLSKISKGP